MTEQFAQEAYVLVPQSALYWLFGSGPDEQGYWFGDYTDDSSTLNERRPAFWWRSKFRNMIEAARGEQATTSHARPPSVAHPIGADQSGRSDNSEAIAETQDAGGENAAIKAKAIEECAKIADARVVTNLCCDLGRQRQRNEHR